MMTTRLCTTDADFNTAMEIRFAVFVDEQNVPAELEADEYDEDAIHLLLLDGEKAIGTARLVDKGNGVVKIGRVAVLPAYRGKGLGNQLMWFALDIAHENDFRLVILDSQTYAIPFYEKLGFTAEGPEFDDAGIPHRRMKRVLSSVGD
jgi:predicted GNAT family N-acyltransferase